MQKVCFFCLLSHKYITIHGSKKRKVKCVLSAKYDAEIPTEAYVPLDCLITQYGFSEYSSYEFVNFLRDSLIDFIGKLRHCSATQSSSASWHLYDDKIFSWKAVIWRKFPQTIRITCMWLMNQTYIVMDF